MANVYPFDPQPIAESRDVIVYTDGDADAKYDETSGTTQVTLDNGDVDITFGPPEKERRPTSEHDDNLAEDMSEAELSTVAERIMLGIEQDIQSRQLWLENMSGGISLLGLEIKNPRGAAASGATPAEGTSTVDHPLLLEAVLRFQANASGELLPSDGPVKVRNDGEGDTLSSRLADALEKDMNHYLTKVATEYYPDTDRMLLMLGFSGISFKKGFHDPIKRRPVIASINAADLIVSNTATDLAGAGRVTHRIMMRPSLMKRMQLVGAYRNIDLPSPGTPSLQNPVDAKISQVQGIAPPTYMEPADQDRELYECYCEIDLPGFEHRIQGEVTGLPLPYKVTIDRESRRILEIRANWEPDDDFCMPRNRIIAYIFVPGLGFYGIGLLNILGNATKAVTAAWRLMIDAGMFANFPGFLYMKSLSKQLTNQFRVAPGTGMAIDSMGQDIRQVVMPLPYKDPSPVFIQLIDNIASTAQRVGGTAETLIGEGKQDAPVGTTLALIEQATKLMSAVHKRLHHAQGQEFEMLKSLLSEDPEALWRHNKKSKVLQMLSAEAGLQPVIAAQEGAELRHRTMFLAALNDCELIPRADPNTSSQTERYLKIVALRQMADTNQNIDKNKVDERAMHVMGIDDPESYFVPSPPPGSPPPPPPPEQVMAQATAVAAQARLTEASTKAKVADFNAANQDKVLAAKAREKSLDIAKEIVIHQSDEKRIAADQERQAQERSDRQRQQDFDRQDQLEERRADRVHKLALATAQTRAKASEGLANRTHEFIQGHLGRRHERSQTGAGLIHEASQAGVDRHHEAGLTGMTHAHEADQAERDRAAAKEQAARDAKAKPKAKPTK